MDLSYFPAITFYELRESNCVQIKCLKLCIQWVLKGFCQVIFYRHCQTSELTFCVWNSPDIQQQLSTSTSCAGGEPGPDRSLARGRKTPSRLLCLRHDEGSRPCCSGCSEDNVAVTLVCCKRAFMPHQFGILRKRQQGRGQRKSNKIRCLKMSKCKEPTSPSASPGINLCFCSLRSRKEIPWSTSPAGSVSLLWSPSLWLNSPLKLLRVKGQAAYSLVIY